MLAFDVAIFYCKDDYESWLKCEVDSMLMTPLRMTQLWSVIDEDALHL